MNQWVTISIGILYTIGALASDGERQTIVRHYECLGLIVAASSQAGDWGPAFASVADVDDFARVSHMKLGQFLNRENFERFRDYASRMGKVTVGFIRGEAAITSSLFQARREMVRLWADAQVSDQAQAGMRGAFFESHGFIWNEHITKQRLPAAIALILGGIGSATVRFGNEGNPWTQTIAVTTCVGGCALFMVSQYLAMVRVNREFANERQADGPVRPATRVELRRRADTLRTSVEGTLDTITDQIQADLAGMEEPFQVLLEPDPDAPGAERGLVVYGTATAPPTDGIVVYGRDNDGEPFYAFISR